MAGNDRQQQLEIANAIKIAREMALLPYARHVASASRTRPGSRRRAPSTRRDEGDAPVEAAADTSVEVAETGDVETGETEA